MDLQKFIERAAPTGILGVKITQNSEELGKYLWDEECRRNIYSASKSFTSAAVGIAVKEGLLTLEEKLELMGAQRPQYKEENWVRMALAFPFTNQPGKKFVYNNVGPYLAGILVQRRAGCDLVSYLMPRLFKPLGIRRPVWECDPMGNTFGAGGLFLTLSELHKLGLLYLQKGVWDGKQIIPEKWVEESTRVQVPTGLEEDYGYGYLFWGGPHGSFRADGKYYQLSIILKSKNAVISTVAECRDGKPLMDAIFEELYPQL